MLSMLSIMGGGNGGRGDRSHAIFSAFNIMSMGVAWKESTPNGPCPLPQLSRRGAPLLSMIVIS